MPKSVTLDDLTSLSCEDLADCFVRKSRAYQSVRGAVAEWHLERHLRDLRDSGGIAGYSAGERDSDKDYRIQLPSGEQKIVEVKNVEVINVRRNMRLMMHYLLYLYDEGLIQLEFLMSRCDHLSIDEKISCEKDAVIEILRECSHADLGNVLLPALPSVFRHSTIWKYRFSARMFENRVSSANPINLSDWLNLFVIDDPVSIDFQRTRNSLSRQDPDRRGRITDGRESRVYRPDEIDIIAACLFARTLRWEFVFCRAKDIFVRDKNGSSKFPKNIRVLGACWKGSLLECL